MDADPETYNEVDDTDLTSEDPDLILNEEINPYEESQIDPFKVVRHEPFDPYDVKNKYKELVYPEDQPKPIVITPEMMAVKSKLEYIWLDGDKPTQNLRSKTLVMGGFTGLLDYVPNWSCNGFHCQQSKLTHSDLILKPVSLKRDPTRINGWLVMCEVFDTFEKPHESNKRNKIEEDKDDKYWFGFE